MSLPEAGDSGGATADDRLWLPYAAMGAPRPRLVAARTDGSRITLDDGRVLIDGIASWWTACHGYNHPHIADSVRAQLARMPHVMLGGLVHDGALRLARRLATLLPGDLAHVFFSDSGSVSVEVAIKMALQYFLNRGETGRTRLLSFGGGYHGDTFMTMSVCDPEEGMHGLFRGVLPEQVIAPLPTDDEAARRFEALLDRHGGTLAAVLVEPLVQGAGGMLMHDPAVLRRIRESCDARGLLMIADEVFTGFGRTGTMFACDAAAIVPDIICLSKALTGGTMALAATVATARVFEAFRDADPARALMHGPTFMGNALACAAANASLDLFERHDRLAAATAIASRLRDGLSPLRGAPNVRDVRVLGAIGVVELDEIGSLDRLKARFIARGLFVRPFRRIVYLTPALTIAEDDLETLIDGVVDIVSEPA